MTDDVEMRFARASELETQGHSEQAKASYLELLKEQPTHFGALNNLGNLVFAQGFTSAARTLYMQAVEHHPHNPKAHVNYANLLAQINERELARDYFEKALLLDPHFKEAHRGIAYLLTELRDEEQAAFHREKAFADEPVLYVPYYGKKAPIEVLLLVSAVGGTIPMQHHFDRHIFSVSVIFVEFFTESHLLPPHQLIVNAIGDADLCAKALNDATCIIKRSVAPVINPPAHVLQTGRANNALRLGTIPHVVTARTLLFPRAKLAASDNVRALLAQEGFSFPLLVRAPGFHTGHYFVRCEDEKALQAALPTLPGDALLVMQFLDAQSNDGKIRKYRVMIINGVLYPLHVAVSTDWKIHYFTADMADNAENRSEDEAFLNNMEQVLGPDCMNALEEIARRLQLDYGGIDFSVSAEGNILLYEANATMVVYPPAADKRWAYRRPATERIMNAIRHMLTHYAS